MKRTNKNRDFVSAELVKKANLILRNFPEIEFAYLYGSALKRSDYEDIDIALFLSAKSKKNWDRIATAVAGSLEREFKKECDVHILQEMPDHLKYRIMSEGKKIIVRNRLMQVRFEARVLSEFLDYKHTYDWLNQRLIERLASG